jgi:hypothetical protein
MTNRTNVEKILTEAREAVDAAQIPDDLRALAFEKAVDLLAGNIQASNGSATATGGGTAGSSTATGVDQRLAKIAQRLGVEVAKLAYVYDLDQDDVTLVVPRSKLDSTKAIATREVALLYAAARQAGGYDETHTNVTSIKSKVDDMGVLDAGNFASQVKTIDGMSVKGATAQSREFKVTQHGYEEAAKVIARVTGGNGS